MTSELTSRTVRMKVLLIEKLMGHTPDRRALLLGSMICALYDAAPENTKDNVDKILANFGKAPEVPHG